ncbi:MAG: polyphosphate polymerase domain-containing protein [Candidatus Izemoplasmatales bacterium]
MELTRTELKFLLARHEVAQLSNQLALTMNRDLYADSRTGEYAVSSVYFDDLYCSRVGEKADGVEYHQKYRVRSYAGGPCRLESKTKVGTLTAKESIWLDEPMKRALLTADADGVAAYANVRLMADVLVRMKLDDLRPAIVVDYVREAWTFPAGDVRVTFDKDVTARLFDSDPAFARRVLEPGQTILEVKYTGLLPETLRKILFHRNHQVVSYSKYYMGWILLNP